MDNENILTEFNAGGSHEANPFGGIQQGVGGNGKTNRVEEGETKAKGYIYPNKRKLSRKMAAKYGIAKKHIGKSYSDISKSLTEQTKGSEQDKMARDTSAENLQRLQLASEEARIAAMSPEEKMAMQQQAEQAQQQQGQQGQPLQEQQQLGDGGNMYEGGGALGEWNADFKSDWGDTGAMDKAGAVAGAAGSVMDMGVEAFGPTGIDMSGEMDPGAKKAVGGAMAGGAAKGAMAGASFGPWGAAIGGVLGAGTAWLGASKYNKEQEEASHNFDMKAKNMENFKEDGGFLHANDGYLNNSYHGGGPIGHAHPHANEGGFDFQSQQSADLGAQIPRATAGVQPNLSADDQLGLNSMNKDKFAFIGDNLLASTMKGDPKEKKEEKDKFNAGSMLRYAPAAMNAYQALTLKKPEQETLDKLDTRYKPGYVDQQTMINKLQRSGNINEAIANASGGSTSAARANMLGAQLNKSRATSDAYLNATNINRGEDARAQQFNLGVDKSNIQQSNLEGDINARNRAAYDTNKSRMLGAIGDDLGNIGLEELRKTYPERAGMDYDTLGRYIAYENARKAKNRKTT